jgi:hypothetical protein
MSALVISEVNSRLILNTNEASRKHSSLNTYLRGLILIYLICMRREISYISTEKKNGDE